MKNRKLGMMKIILPMMLVANYAHADEFWANRLGGDSAELELINISKKSKKSRSKQNVVYPGSDGSYEITTESKARVQTPFSTKNLLKKKRNNNGSTELSTVAAEVSDDGVLEVEAGEWVVEPDLTSGSGKKHRNVAYVDLDDSPYTLEIEKVNVATNKGTNVFFTASILNENGNIAKNVRNVEATATYIIDEEDISVIQLRDTGSNNHGDSTRGDGVYSGILKLTNAGRSSVLIRYKGTLDDNDIERTAVVQNDVSKNRLSIVSSEIAATHGYVEDAILEDDRYGLPLVVKSVKGGIPDIVDTFAEVWAKTSEGKDISVGWIGGLVKPIAAENKKYVIPFSFHSGWLESYDDISEPLSIRNITVRDIDSGDSILSNPKNVGVMDLPVNSPSFRSGKLSDSPEVSSAMTSGIHPSVINGTFRAGTATGSDRIVLALHGFCDNGAMKTSHFNSTVQAKAYRYSGSSSGESATRYATDVMNKIGWRAGKVRGIVAHSHGGMVAATLLQNYSYIFADNASSTSPNVVSMGTPYYGTSLLNSVINGGWLESLAISIHGLATGCSIPSELYPSSNDSWSNSIGWRAKSQISAWYTTHTKSRWWRPRDCNAGSYLINGSDDGVIAPNDGLYFASGGNNYRKYSGHCHLAGMGQNDQWDHPDFVNQVNSLFSSETEAWQPF